MTKINANYLLAFALLLRFSAILYKTEIGYFNHFVIPAIFDITLFVFYDAHNPFGINKYKFYNSTTFFD